MEVGKLGRDFVAAAQVLQQRHPELQVVIAGANEHRVKQINGFIKAMGIPTDSMLVVNQQTQAVLAAADAVLVASGTATLETMLFAKPMLVCYRLSGMSYRVFKRKLQIQHVSLPNLLAGKEIVEELLQDQVQVPVLADKMEALLFNDQVREQQQQAFMAMHDMLACSADERAADVVSRVIKEQAGVVIGTTDV